ncbi:MAG TPA: GDSL-type esterase/lipase family protein [Rhodopila sp.]|jgi:lysophospholipase L1-like esterase|nr:GDSL-type esterase/lipase family protein [Rhodopila sp.]
MPPHEANWIAAWTGAAQGPYPLGNPTAQPDMRFALPSAEQGAQDQTFRLIVRPHLWGRRARLRLSNAHGTRPVTFAGTHVGLQGSGALLVAGTNRPVRFAGADAVTVPPGASALSDPVDLPWVGTPTDALLAHRKLAVSFHLPGPTGPMTWHAKALTTSYLTPPGSGAHAATEAEDPFAFTTASWFFLDQVQMDVPGARGIVAIGDSITDGTCSTMNGDDRWPDFLGRRIHAVYGSRYSVVNQGIGGNRIVSPADYAADPVAGGPSALDRLERDVISLPNVAAVIWLEGINDFGHGGGGVADVIAGIRQGVARLRQAIPGVRIAMGTLVPALNATNGTHGTPAVETMRQACNDFIRTCGLFDAVVDFDAVTRDPASGELKAEFVPDSSVGGPGDKLHPNRVGYRAMAQAVDLRTLLGEPD